MAKQTSSGRKSSEPKGQARGNKPETRSAARRDDSKDLKRSGSTTNPSKSGRYSTRTGRD